MERVKGRGTTRRKEGKKEPRHRVSQQLATTDQQYNRNESTAVMRQQRNNKLERKRNHKEKTMQSNV
jgi:hypothetical protein